MHYQIDPGTKNNVILIHVDEFLPAVKFSGVTLSYRKGCEPSESIRPVVIALGNVKGVQSYHMDGYSVRFLKGKLFDRQQVIKDIVECLGQCEALQPLERVL